jgi:AbrB family looped-hinge helix DNA binding protein
VTTTTLSTKGQIIIPQEIRRRHGWEPGLTLELEERGDVLVLRPVRALPKTSVADLLGCLPYKGAPKSLEEMDAGIAKGARKSR